MEFKTLENDKIESVKKYTMEFRTLENDTIESIKKGLWKPLFKNRLNDNYHDTYDRTEYELSLWNRIFANNDNEIIIRKNTYPFNFGEDTEQFVIWIRDINKDPGIRNIVEMIKKDYLDKDYVIYINKISYRSIQSILHYHVIIKNPSAPFYLKKLIVIHNYGNTEPIIKFPVLEKLLPNQNLSINSNKLSQIGFINSINFGNNLKQIYELNDEIISDSIFLSNSINTCCETMKNIIIGLFGSDNQHIIQTDEILREMDNISLKQNNNITIIEHIEKYNNILNKIETIFGSNKTILNHKNIVSSLFNNYSSLQSYNDMGTDYKNILDKNTQIEFDTTTKILYNLLVENYQKQLSNQIEKFINYLISCDNKLILCSTDHLLVFMLVKYFSFKSGTCFDYIIPESLSNIRIEEWSDGIIKIFYNNWYLGKKLTN